LIGCDFSSRPTPRKPIVLAYGQRFGTRVVLDHLRTFDSLGAFAHWLCEPGDWLGGFDLPFGLPRALVQTLGWPLEWEPCVRHYAAFGRPEIRAIFKSFCDARPSGSKFAHRATDVPAGSSPSMKWVHPPVAYMLHAGVPLLLDAGVHLPGLQVVDDQICVRPVRIGLEAYPGLLAREVLGRRSYKSDERARQTPEQRNHRSELVRALQIGSVSLGLRLELPDALHEALVADPSGDRLDAVLCLMQVAWASRHGWPLFGLPAAMDRLEGWIVTAREPAPR
jgi:hypothetical protein